MLEKKRNMKANMLYKGFSWFVVVYIVAYTITAICLAFCGRFDHLMLCVMLQPLAIGLILELKPRKK